MAEGFTDREGAGIGHGDAGAANGAQGFFGAPDAQVGVGAQECRESANVVDVLVGDEDVGDVGKGDAARVEGAFDFAHTDTGIDEHGEAGAGVSDFAGIAPEKSAIG